MFRRQVHYDTPRVYVATAMTNKPAAAAAARALRSLGILVTSMWHDRPHDAYATRQVIARDCQYDVARANTLVVLAHPDMRGAYVELGLAYSAGHRVIVVADRALLPTLSLMIELPGVELVATTAEAFKHG